MIVNIILNQDQSVAGSHALVETEELELNVEYVPAVVEPEG